MQSLQRSRAIDEGENKGIGLQVRTECPHTGFARSQPLRQLEHQEQLERDRIARTDTLLYTNRLLPVFVISANAPLFCGKN